MAAAARAIADRNTFGHPLPPDDVELREVVTSCHMSSVLQTTKHDLNPVAPFVATLVVLDSFFA